MHTLTIFALSLFTGTVALTNYSQALESQVTNPVQPQILTQLPTTELETIAQNITVQVRMGEDRGSGILIAKNNDTYIVITNAHVTDRGETYSIQTSDGMEHEATLVDSTEQNDLAVLEFSSSNQYQVATVGNSDSITEGETVIAAGFPDGEEKLLVTEGAISLITEKPLNKGYAIGFSNETVQGMSGGALLNSNGEVIAILGKGKDAILDTAYDYMDGTTPTDEEIATFREVSFSIPIANIANLSPSLAALVPGESNPNIAQQPETESTPAPKPEYTGIVKTVDDIAEQITVRIDNTEKDVNGSGVIVAKQGNTYYGLTAKHVLCTRPSVIKPECEPNGTYQIVTNDGATHQINYQTVEAKQAWLDIAIFSFESNNDYAVATIGAYNPSYQWIFVSGFPQQNVGSNGKPARLITGGLLWEEEVEEIVVKDTGSLAQSKVQGQDSLVYTNLSYPGMSGGAVLDSEGRLIGINTGAENELYFDEAGDYDEYSLGYSLGESVSDFLGYLEANKTDLKEDWLSIIQEPAKTLNKDEFNSFKTQLIITERPNDDTDLAAWMNYGNQLWRYTRWDEAVAAFDKVIAIDPNFDKAYYAKGSAYFNLKEYEQGVTALLKATQINPNPYFYWRLLGYAYKGLEQYDRAIAAYDKAIEKNQNEATKDFVLYEERGNILSANKNYQSAIASYSEAIEINPNYDRAYINRGLIYESLQQYEQALADFNKAIEINSNYDKAYNNRGFIYESLQQYEQALADYTKAIELNPNYDGAYNNRGLIYESLQQYEQALADYTKAIELNPNYDGAYINRGNTYKSLQQYEQALADFNKAIELNPNYANAYVSRGSIYENWQQYELALADYTKAIELNPNDAKIYNNRGLTYKSLQQYEIAIADFNKAIEINPQDVLAYNNRGITYKSMQQYELALADFNKAIEINPNFPVAYANLGSLYIQLENNEEARANLEKAQQLSISQGHTAFAEIVANDLEQLASLPDKERANQSDSDTTAYVNQDQEDQLVLAKYNQAIQNDPNNASHYFYRGIFYREREEDQLAIADYSKAIQIDPNDALAYHNRGLVYLQLKNTKKARTNLQKAQDLYLSQNNIVGAEKVANLLEQL